MASNELNDVDSDTVAWMMDRLGETATGRITVPASVVRKWRMVTLDHSSPSWACKAAIINLCNSHGLIRH